jgi:hypothetical protein
MIEINRAMISANSTTIPTPCYCKNCHENLGATKLRIPRPLQWERPSAAISGDFMKMMKMMNSPGLQSEQSHRDAYRGGDDIAAAGAPVPVLASRTTAPRLSKDLRTRSSWAGGNRSRVSAPGETGARQRPPYSPNSPSIFSVSTRESGGERLAYHPL